MPGIKKEDLDQVFTYHAPTAEQLEHYVQLRQTAKAFAAVILEHTPQCADQTAAIRLLRESLMTANAAVALKGAV